jgi:hypothetical protein
MLPSQPLTLNLMETLDLFFRRAFYCRNASYPKIKRIKLIEKLQNYKFGSVYFWDMIHPKKVQNLQNKVQS